MTQLTEIVKHIYSKYKEHTNYIVGDFNMHHPLWEESHVGNIPHDVKLFANMLLEADITIHNNGTFTRLGSKGERNTSVDLTLSNQTNITRNTTWDTLDIHGSSDHLPIHITTNNITNTYKPLEHDKYKYHQMNKLALQTEFRNVEWNKLDNNNPIVLKALIEDKILECMNKHVPRNKAGQTIIPQKAKSTVPWWNNECKIMIEKKHKARNKYNRNKTTENLTEFKKLKNETTKLIKATKKKHWENFITKEIDINTNPGKVWKMVNAMSGKYSKKKGIGDMINDNNVKLTTTKEKCNYLAENYEKVSSDEGYSNEFLLRKKELEKTHGNFLKQKVKNTNERYNNPITIKEIRIALRNKRDTAEGKDNIRYSVYKLLPHEGLKQICKLFNIYWESGQIPQEFKHAITIPIIKPDKDPKKAKSYRPISLTSHLGKLLETIINRRLVHHLEENDIIRNNQSGFRKNRQTLDHIVRLTDAVEKCIQRGKLNIAVALDLEKAFDTVHRDGILMELKSKQIGGNMYNYIQSFLDSRTLEVRLDNELSETKEISNGVPQGAVISPTLFNMMINSIENNEEIHKNTELGSFADDQALWLKPNICIKKGGKLVDDLGRPSIPQKAIEAAATTLVKNLNEKGFKVNVEKTQVIVFNTPREITLNINGTKIESKPYFKYLGVTFDKKLTFSKHIDNLREKAMRPLNLLRYLAGKGKWGANSNTLKVIYNNLVKSKLTYGEEVYNRAPKSKLDTLENIQYQALKCITGIHDKAASKQGLHILSGIPPLSITRKIRINNLATRITSNTNNPAKHIFLDEEESVYKNKNVYTLRKEHKNISKEAQIENRDTTKTTTDIPIWDIQNINIDNSVYNLVQQNKNSQTSPETNITEYIQNNYPNHIQILTKGQKHKERCGGGYTFLNQNNTSKTSRYTDNTSKTTTELQAILDAMTQFNNLYKDNQLLLCTKNRTAIQEIDLEGKNTRLDIVKKIYNEQQKAATTLKNNITILWIPDYIHAEKTLELSTEISKKLELESITSIGISYKEVKTVHHKQILTTIWQNEYTNSKHTTGPKKGQTKHLELKHIIPSVTTAIKTDRNNRLLNKLRINLFYSQHKTKDCNTCQANLSIDHVLLFCKHFEETRTKLKSQLNKQHKQVTRKNILDPNIDTTTAQTVRKLIKEIDQMYTI